MNTLGKVQPFVDVVQFGGFENGDFETETAVDGGGTSNLYIPLHGRYARLLSRTNKYHALLEGTQLLFILNDKVMIDTIGILFIVSTPNEDLTKVSFTRH